MQSRSDKRLACVSPPQKSLSLSLSPSLRAGGDVMLLPHCQFTNEGEVRVEIDARPLSLEELPTLVTPQVAHQREKEHEHQAALAAGLGLPKVEVGTPMALPKFSPSTAV